MQDGNVKERLYTIQLTEHQLAIVLDSLKAERDRLNDIREKIEKMFKPGQLDAMRDRLEKVGKYL